MNKTMILSILFALSVVLAASQVQAEFSADVRQALQKAALDVQAELQKSGIPAGKTISLLPIRGDDANYVEGLLKNAITAAGLTYVEGKSDPFWDELLREIEWDERKDDILDADTLVKFGKLKATQLLMYGSVREAVQQGNHVFVELELHLGSIETKQHLWGNVFAKRFYLPGEMKGIVGLDENVRKVLQDLFVKAAPSLKSSAKLSSVRNIAVLPLAGDMDGYAKQLTVKSLSETSLVPRELAVGTPAEALALLRDQPQQAEAFLYGALRDLSLKEYKLDPMRTRQEITAEVQLQIQAVPSGDILWSDTLNAKGEFMETQTAYETAIQYKKWLLIAGGVLVGLIVLMFLFKAMSRPR